MQLYYSFESTPLKFHKAFYKVICPILIAIQAFLLLATIGHLSDHEGYYNPGTLVLNLLLYGLSIIFLGIITYGFSKKKEYAWYMVYAYLGLTVFSKVISFLLMQPYSLASTIGQIIGTLTIPTLIGVYYYKRKPLFVASNIENTDEIATHTLQNPETTYYENGKVTIKYCRKCGHQVTKDSVFCNKCGTKLGWN